VLELKGALVLAYELAAEMVLSPERASGWAVVLELERASMSA
jgi:hypothetical protein